MPITKTSFGVINGVPVPLYTMENSGGMRVRITPYGATVTSISVPDGANNRAELAAGFDQLSGYFGEEYRNNAPYFGSTVGRYASRIKDGKFSLDGKEYTLAVNDGSNHLHGGLEGFDKRLWEAEEVSDDTLRFTLQSPDGDEGYPGNLTVSVTYRLTEDNALEISYTGTTDRATPLSLTNHTYFNLSGFREPILKHTARIDAAEFLTPDDTNVPVGERSEVAGTVADLRQDTQLDGPLAKMATGFEHYYAFSAPASQRNQGTGSGVPAQPRTTVPRAVARFTHPESGRELRVLTTEPGALFYTGYFTSDNLQRENGDRYGRYRAFCFETSRYPNGPNLAEPSGAILRPGEPYASTTIYQFVY